MLASKYIEEFELAKTFNIVSGKEVYDTPNTVINDAYRKNMMSQYQFLESEIRELEVAEGRPVKSDIEILDAICDGKYILYGTQCYMGFSPLDYETLKGFQINLSDNIFDEVTNLRALVNAMKETIETCDDDSMYDTIQIILVAIDVKLTHLAEIYEYDYKRAFAIVHEANMSKFCSTIEEARLTVEYYEKIKFTTDYKYPDYRLSPDHTYYIVYNNDTSENPINNGKILKCVNWKEPDLKPLFDNKIDNKIDNKNNNNKNNNEMDNKNDNNQKDNDKMDDKLDDKIEVGNILEPGICLVIGPMFSDKTSYLFSEYDKHVLQGYKCVIIKYSEDTRYGSNENILVTHDGKSRPAIGSDELFIASSQKYIDFSEYDAIFIDEVQFFNINFDNLISYSKSKKIYAAGLSGDYLRKPFDNISNLIPLASKIKHMRAICLHNGKKAPFSKRLVSNNNRVLIGDNKIYEAVDLRNYFNM